MQSSSEELQTYLLPCHLFSFEYYLSNSSVLYTTKENFVYIRHLKGKC